MRYKRTLVLVSVLCALVGFVCLSMPKNAFAQEFGIRAESKDLGLPKADEIRSQPVGMPAAPTEKFQKYEKPGMPPAPATLESEKYKGIPPTPETQKTFRTQPKVVN